MKTPDEIKKGLECCKPIWKNDHWKTCDQSCPYVAEAVFCRTMLNGDALGYISQLESQNRCFKEIKESCEKRMIEMAQRMPRWISVEERLPEDYEDVVIIMRDGASSWYRAAYREYGGWSFGGGRRVNDEVTHWMPIPQPPKEE